MAIGRETLSIVQFLKLIDRDGSDQSQLVIHNFSPFSSCQGQSTQQHGCRHGGHRGTGEKLGQSAIGIALYQRPVVRPTFLDPTRV